MVRLDKICDIERAKNGKVYPDGTVLIQISATRGQTILLEKDSFVKPSMYACLIPKVDIDSLYLKTCIDGQIETFLSKYANGINIPVDNLKYIRIPKKHIKTQRMISSFIRLFDLYYQQEEKIIELEQDLKKNMLENMFV